MRGRIRVLFQLPCLIFALVGCSRNPTTSDPPSFTAAPVKDALVSDCEPGRRGGTLIYAAPAEPTSYNRFLARDQGSFDVIQRIHAGLIALNRASQKLEPALAKSWQFSADHRSLEVQLRQGVRFSDGHPFTADDVVFTFTVLLDRRLNLPMSAPFLAEGEPVRLETAGTYTLKFLYPKPTVRAVNDLADVPILPRHKLEAVYQAGRLESTWTGATPASEIVGLGPFRHKEYTAGQRLVLERNPHYWKADRNGARLPYLDSLVYVFVPDHNARRLRFEAGEVDMLDDLRPDDFVAIQRVEQQRGLQLMDIGPDINSEFLWFNQNPENNPKTKKPYLAPHKYRWFSDVRFRRAVAHAIDRSALCQVAYMGKATPAHGPFNQSNRLWGNPAIAKYEYDSARARALLREAGFTGRDGGPLLDRSGLRVEFSLLTNAGNSLREKMAAMVQQDLAKLGIAVRLATLDMAAVGRAISGSEYEACLLGFRNGDPDPSSQQNVWLSRAPMHPWYPNQKTPATEWERRLDELMMGQMSAFDFAQRKRLVDEAQQIIAENVPIIYLVSKDILVGAKRKLGNFKPSVLDHRTLWNSEELYFRAGS